MGQDGLRMKKNPLAIFIGLALITSLGLAGVTKDRWYPDKPEKGALTPAVPAEPAQPAQPAAEARAAQAQTSESNRATSSARRGSSASAGCERGRHASG